MKHLAVEQEHGALLGCGEAQSREHFDAVEHLGQQAVAEADNRRLQRLERGDDVAALVGERPCRQLGDKGHKLVGIDTVGVCHVVDADDLGRWPCGDEYAR
jgi:hypothetical protein